MRTRRLHNRTRSPSCRWSCKARVGRVFHECCAASLGKGERVPVGRESVCARRAEERLRKLESFLWGAAKLLVGGAVCVGVVGAVFGRGVR